GAVATAVLQRRRVLARLPAEAEFLEGDLLQPAPVLEQLGEPAAVVVQAGGAGILPALFQVHADQLAEDRQVFGGVGGRQERREGGRIAEGPRRLVGIDDLVDARPGSSVGGAGHAGWSSWIRASSRLRKPCRTRSTVRFERRTFSVISATS